MSEIPEDIRQAADECAMQIWQGGCATWFEARDLIQAAICAERERCAKLVEEGFPRKITDHYCPHKRLQWEDCDLCVVDAIRSSSPSLHTAEQEVG